MLHGVNCSNIEWEVRGMRSIMDALIAEKGIAETIVVFPNGSSGWRADTSAGHFRTIVVDEIVPLVDGAYRTIADREHRGISGVSMGGHGSFSIGLEHPELFSSIASHIGALDLPPLAGTPAERAANAKYNPATMVDAMTTEQLLAHTYYFDAGEQDDFGFDNHARLMNTRLMAKNVPHEWQIGDGRHADSYWVPKLDRSFGLHTAQFDGHPYEQEPEPKTSVSVTMEAGGTVPATLSLTLGAPASFGAFTPGVTREYMASTIATVISSAADAALTVSDSGHLANGAFTLPQPLRAEIAPGAWPGPVSNATSTITFRQAIDAADALRTGVYSKTLTFTLSTTNP
jgi:esterase/lipase superfamily enzyme